MQRKCDCLRCKARRDEEFRAITEAIFSETEVEGIAESILADFPRHAVMAFAADERSDDDGA